MWVKFPSGGIDCEIKDNGLKNVGRLDVELEIWLYIAKNWELKPAEWLSIWGLGKEGGRKRKKKWQEGRVEY